MFSPERSASETPAYLAAGGADTRVETRLDSDQDHISQALTRWGAGDFDGCIRQLDEVPLTRHTSESVLLRARALLRIHKAEAAEAWLRLTEACHTSEDALATHAMLLGNACARLERFDRAAVLFDRARTVAAHPTIVAETAYYHALALWQARDFRSARAALQTALTDNQDIISARARQLLGFIAIGEGKFSESHTHFCSALDWLGRCNASDSHLEATLLHQLAIGGSEVDLIDPSSLDDRARKFPWTPNLVMENVQTLRHVGLAFARLGQQQVAMERFAQAAQVLPNSAWAIIGFAEAATYAVRLNEPVSAAGYLRLAREVADTRVNWDLVEGEERLGLLQLATVLARSGDGVSARRYLQVYYGPDHRGARLPALSALHMDLRLQCFERHAEALIHGALQDSDAMQLLSDVACAWRRLKYYSRADEAREDIRALTHRSYDRSPELTYMPHENSEDAGVDTMVSHHIFGFSSSQGVQLSIFLGDARRPKTVTMTVQQDRIIRLLVVGKTIAEIARELSLEQKTVRNHLGNLYAMFEVRGQPQLIVAIMRDSRLRRCFAS